MGGKPVDQPGASFHGRARHPSLIVLVHDRAGSITHAHGAVESLLGVDPAALVGRPLAELSDDETAPAGLVGRGEIRLRHRDGGWRWFDASPSEPDESGTITTTLVDITDQRSTAARQRDAIDKVRESEALFRSLAASSPIGIFRVDVDLRCTYVNDRFSEITGHPGSAETLPTLTSLLHPDDAEALRSTWEATGRIGRPMTAQARVVRPSGGHRWVAIRTSPLHDGVGAIAGHVGTLEDVTERVDRARDMARLSQVLGATSDLVAITDREGRLLYVNDAFCEFFDVARDDIDTFDFLAVTPAWAQERYAGETIPTLRDEGIWSGEFAYYRHGVEISVSALFIAHRGDDGHLEFVSSITRDISEHKALEERLAHQATHDPLTGLPNRALFLDRLHVALARTQRTDSICGVLFCDLDHFKVVNDSLGHDGGDQLLITLAGRLRAVVRPSDTVARFGGDEFVVLCEDLDTEADGHAIARRIGEMLREPVSIERSELFVSGSLGMAFTKGDSTTAEALIRDADAAMYRAKARGRARFEVFDEDMRRSAVDRLDIERALRRALDRRELRVLYQPCHNIATGRVTGIEALLRWEHPERGLLAPPDFLHIAEETGLIVGIGRWVAEQACSLVARIDSVAHGNEPVRVALNLSARELSRPALVADLDAVFLRTGIDAGRVEVEIAESVAMRDIDARSAVFDDLKSLGVAIVIDDFGSGHSALTYLRRYPLDALKIDRALIDALEADPNDEAVVAAIISMARSLGVQTVAEGVESQTQLERLRALGCDSVQGYVFERPLTGAAVLDLVAD